MARPGLLRHPKFMRLSARLKSRALAIGSLELVWSVAYEGADPVIGTSDDVEHAADWRGKRGQLAAALVETGFLDNVDGIYRVHDLLDHAPEYVRKKHGRRNQRVTPEMSGHRPDSVESKSSQSPDSVETVSSPAFISLRSRSRSLEAGPVDNLVLSTESTPKPQEIKAVSEMPPCGKPVYNPVESSQYPGKRPDLHVPAQPKNCKLCGKPTFAMCGFVPVCTDHTQEERLKVT